MRSENDSAKLFTEAAQAIGDPDRKYSVMPFWFWNDRLDEAEICRQIADFEAHGVYGFVIHPRIGLPEDFIWMSDAYLDVCETAIDEASRLGMKVLLYDEGMYPSGSSAGQVVATDPAFQARCLAKVDLEAGEEPTLDGDANLIDVYDRPRNRRFAVVERPSESYIRGLRYLPDGKEEMFRAADLLNQAAVDRFIELVYQGYTDRLRHHFGRTVIGIFTDEPHQLAKCREPGPSPVFPGTRGIAEKVSDIIGYDFTPHVPALWYDDEPDAHSHRRAFEFAVEKLHDVVYYTSLSKFCTQHDLSLTGHPHGSDNTGSLKYFGIPGQDNVLRDVEPDKPSALQGFQSVTAKCSSSIMLHRGLRRNLNEYCGGYGHDFSWDDMNWLANYLLVRGVNLLVPHAFYYSVRGPRRDERPPQLGPNASWWDRYQVHADACRRLCWLNTDSTHVCNVAVLGGEYSLPIRCVAPLFRNQIDFNYIDIETLTSDADIGSDGIRISGMHYEVLVTEKGFGDDEREPFGVLESAGRVIAYDRFADETQYVEQVRVAAKSSPILAGVTPSIRVRQVEKNGFSWMMLFNEERASVNVAIDPAPSYEAVYDPVENTFTHCDGRELQIDGHQLVVLITKYQVD